MVTMPPRHGKSELVSIRFPAWYLGKHPSEQFIGASYGVDLAFDFSRGVRNLIASPEYRALFPDVELAADSQAKDRWHTSVGGGYVSAGLGISGVGTAITGRGADILSIDDPVKGRATAESETMREAIWRWYTADAYSRLQPNAAVVLTLTRWHEDDLAGRLINAEAAGGDKWVRIDFPALDEHGAALWEEAYPASALKQIRTNIGEYDWASLYEQRPRPIEGSFFNVGDLLDNGNAVEAPAKCDAVFATIDSATKTGKENDGTAVVYWAVNRSFGYPLVVLDWDIVQIEGAMLEGWLPGVFQQLEAFAAQCKARSGNVGVWIEDKASGMILLQQAERRGWQVHPIDSKLTSVGKTERAINVSGYVFRKMVKLSRAAYDRVKLYKSSSKNHLVSQVLNFHVGTKDMGADDLLDAFCYGISLALGDNQGF